MLASVSQSRFCISAEPRANIVNERLIIFCHDQGSKDGLKLLMTREIAHMKASMAVLDGLGLNALKLGKFGGKSTESRDNRTTAALADDAD